MIQSMIEPAYGLNKDFRTMSSKYCTMIELSCGRAPAVRPLDGCQRRLTSKALASTIMPISDEFFPLKKSRSKSSTATSFSRTYEDDFRDGLQIPLPPSSTSSQSGGALSVGVTRGDAERSTQEYHAVRDIERLAKEEHTHGSDDGSGADNTLLKIQSESRDNRAQGEQVSEAVVPDKKSNEAEGMEDSIVKDDIIAVGIDKLSVPGPGEPTGEDIRDIPITNEVMENQRSKHSTGESAGIGDESIQAPSEKALEESDPKQQGQEVTDRSAELQGNEFRAKPLQSPLEQAPKDSQLSDAGIKAVPVLGDQSQQALSESCSSVSLQEVGLLVRQKDYKQQCLEAMQNEVQDLTHRCASFQRRICLQSHLYNLMLNHFRAENSVDFSFTYQQSVEARDSRINLLSTSNTRSGQGIAPPQDSWVSKLSPTSTKTVTELLHQIREGPTFLPDCLVNLSSFQLGSLAPRTPDHSAAPSPQPGSSILSRSLDWGRHRTAHFSDARLKSDQVRHKPLALLVHGAFDVSCSSGCREGHLRRERLIDSCVRLISSGKKGSNDFVLSILETLVESSPWPSKLQLEQYITRLILDGDFVLESLEHQHLDFSEAATVSNARNAVATAEFYDRGLRILLDLLSKDSTCSVIPEGILEFIRSVLSRIADPKQRSKARDFFVSRWYCSAFLSKALMYPEVSSLPQRPVCCMIPTFIGSWYDDATPYKRSCTTKDIVGNSQKVTAKSCRSSFIKVCRL